METLDWKGVIKLVTKNRRIKTLESAIFRRRHLKIWTG